MDHIPPVTYQEAEALVAQCLLSMANEPFVSTAGVTTPQCDEPEALAEEEESTENNTDMSWSCHKCNMTNAAKRKRCQGCLGWRGGVRNFTRRLTNTRKVSAEDENDNMQIELRSKETYSFDKSGAVLPDPNQWEQEKYSMAQCDMVWDSTMAGRASIEVSLLESIIPHDRKESALTLFHENSYQLNGILDKVMREEPNHGMNWSPASKKNFTSNIDRKKDFTLVAKAMSKSTGDCQAYYYSSFKNTREYLKLKRTPKHKVRVTTRSSSSGANSGTASSDWKCRKCLGEGELLVCDMCQSMVHLRCASPPLDAVPTGSWFCEHCDPHC